MWDVLLLWLALIHGANGMRTIVNDYTNPRHAAEACSRAPSLAAAVVLSSSAPSSSSRFDPCPAGAADAADLLALVLSRIGDP